MSGATSAQRFYGRWAWFYDRLARYAPGIGSIREDAADALALSSGDTVVDMGCGTGANLPFLRERVGPEGTVIGVDFTGPVLARAARLVERRGWDNVHVVRGDATRRPVSGPADGILASFVVGMLADPAGAVDDWCDLVAPGGSVVLVDAAPTAHPYGWPVNAAFRAVLVVSTPPTLKVRYDESLDRTLATRVRAARRALRERATDVSHQERTLGVVRLTAGRLQDG